MAISRKTQKDIGQYEPKFIGPFTGRQSAAVGIGGALCFATDEFRCNDNVYDMCTDNHSVLCIRLD